MAENADSETIALLPIQPRYAKAIMAGHKRVEFRRQSFRKQPDYVVLYASSPVKGIVGFFAVSHMTEAPPDELWERFGDQGGIEANAFRMYYRGAKHAVAIGIGDVVAFDEPLSLQSIGADFVAIPQSTVYISRSAFDDIRGRARLCHVRKNQKPDQPLETHFSSKTC